MPASTRNLSVPNTATAETVRLPAIELPDDQRIITWASQLTNSITTAPLRCPAGLNAGHNRLRGFLVHDRARAMLGIVARHGVTGSPPDTADAAQHSPEGE